MSSASVLGPPAEPSTVAPALAASSVHWPMPAAAGTGSGSDPGSGSGAASAPGPATGSGSASEPSPGPGSVYGPSSSSASPSASTASLRLDTSDPQSRAPPPSAQQPPFRSIKMSLDGLQGSPAVGQPLKTNPPSDRQASNTSSVASSDGHAAGARRPRCSIRPPQGPNPQAGSLVSPKHGNVSLTTTPEYCELADLITKTSPQVVRNVVRDFWGKCLLGSEFHLAFITNAALHWASPSMLSRAVQDHGQKMVRSSKQHVVAHLTTEDLDEVADLLLAKVSNDFLDKSMAKRLETIRARPLVNALARAERLGYDLQDIVEEKTANSGEHVLPSLHPTTAPPVPSQPVPLRHVSSRPVPLQSRPPPSQSQPGPLRPVPSQPLPPPQAPVPTAMPQHHQTPKGRSGGPADASMPLAAGPADSNGIIRCSRCGRPCSGEQALRYHTARRACEHTHKYSSIDKDICPHCGCLFVSNGGLQYHVKSHVCGSYSEAAKKQVVAEIYGKFGAAGGHGGRGSASPAVGTPTPGPGPIPGPKATPSTTQHRTPGQMVAAVAAAGSGSLSWTPSSRGYSTPLDDPYAKLTPEQRAAFEQDMRQAEEKYGALMQKALSLPPKERDEELNRLKNSYNTKQSVTRKKYGIRLRERRSKAELESERNRLLGRHASASGSDSGGHPRSPKRPRLGSEGQADSGTARKRPAADASGGPAVSAAAAEHTGPKALVTPSKLQSVALEQAAQSSGPKGTLDDPMEIDSSQDNESDTDSDDEDIPAHLPATKA